MAKRVRVSPERAREMMVEGKVPVALRVNGDLGFGSDLWRLDEAERDRTLPRALPRRELLAESIEIRDGSRLASLPQRVCCNRFTLFNYPCEVPEGMRIERPSPQAGADPQIQGMTVHLYACSGMTRLPSFAGDTLQSLGVNQCRALTTLTPDLRTEVLRLEGLPHLRELPDDLQVTSVLSILACSALTRLANAVDAREITVQDCPALEEVPDGWFARQELVVARCARLRRLPRTVVALRFTAADLPQLNVMPDHVRAQYVDLSGCTGLVRWDDPKITELRQLSVRGCTRLESLPPNLRQVDQLDIGGCERLVSLPPHLRIRQWVDVAGSGVRRLPPSPEGVAVRWNGVEITGQIAFHPETLEVREALTHPNAEVRRVMLGRIGPERLVAEAQPEVLDVDADAGGLRRLVRVEMPDDEPLVALQVRDPSTGREYLLRVPPTVASCKAAAAWIAGFDDPDDYHPVTET